MPYERKTIDTWEIHVDYGEGWEYEITEYSRHAAHEQRRTYRENCPQYPLKIVRRRQQKSKFSQAELDAIWWEIKDARQRWQERRRQTS